MATKYPAVPDVDKVTTLSEDITNLKNKVTHILESSFTVHDFMKDLVEEGETRTGMGDATGQKDGEEGASIEIINITNDFPNDTSYVEKDLQNAEMVLEENRLLRIIKRIQLQRNRAGYQNILEFARRENNNLDMGICKKIINNLISKDMVTNKGKNGNESFKILEKNDGTAKSAVVITDESKKVLTKDEKLSTVTEADSTLNALGDFIDDKFYDVLINLIKKEVEIAINNISKVDSNNSYHKDIMDFQTKEMDNLRSQLANAKSHKENYLKEIDNDMLNYHKDTLKNLIETQKKDIEFLRNEILSKDKIIQMLLQEKDNKTTEVRSEVKGNVFKIADGKNISTEPKKTTENGVINRKRSILIMGDSMIKDIDQSKVRKGLHNNEKVYIKSFPGATTNHMKSYTKPSKEYNNDLVILHCGTNDLRSNKHPEEIAKEITDLAVDLKNENNDVMVSSIAPRHDKLNQKGIKVNNLLLSLCLEHNIHLIDNSNIKTDFHLNNSGLHLNFKGTYVLGGNFVNAINI